MAYGPDVRRRFAAASRRRLATADPDVASGQAEDRALNVWVKFELRVRDSVVEQVGYEVFGCPETIAAVDLIAERLEGREVATIPDIDLHAIAAELSVPVEKLGKLLRIEDAVRACLDRIDVNAEGMQGRKR